MIDVFDLRIGNWVDYSGIYDTVDCIAPRYLHLTQYSSIEYKDVSPIPLSPEVLFDNLGFAGKYKSVGYSFTRDGVNLSSQDEDDFGNPIKDYVFHVYYNHSGPPIYYVHQIQNLFYALTNKELNYKPLK